MDNQAIKNIMNRWHSVFVVSIPFMLSLITFMVYYPALWYMFMFDDLPTIVNYPHIRYIDFHGQFFANPRWISRLLNQITYHFWGPNPFAFRIVNVFMHLAIGVMIFALIYCLFSNLKKNQFLKEHSLSLASITSLLFLLHPVQTQTVTYITQMRLEGLVVFLAMGVLLFFTYATRTTNKNHKYFLHGLSLVLTAFAAGTKEVIVVLPALIVLVDWFFIAEGDWKSFKSRLWIHALHWVVLYGVMLKYGLLAPNYVKAITTNPVHNNRGNILTNSATEDITWYPFAISQFKVLLHYLVIFLCPIGLSFDYDVKLSNHLYNLDVVIPFLILGALVAAAVWLYHTGKNTVFAFCLAWFFVTMLPRASIFLSTELICDYKTYPAAFGMMLLVAFILVRVAVMVLNQLRDMAKERNRGIAILTSTTVLCLALACASGVRNQIWRSELDFWGDSIKHAPKARGYNNYAIALWELGRSEEAMSYFRQAIEKDDWYAEPHVNLATIYQIKKDHDKAFDHYRRALEIGEAHPELFNNLGMLHFENQAWDAAESCLKQAIELRPDYSRSHYFLGKIYQINNRSEEAFHCYENALKGDYQDAELYYLHGSVCVELGLFERGIPSFEKIGPDYQDSAYQLACCYYAMPQYAKAAHYFSLAHKKDPGNQVCMYNCAQSFLNVRKYEQALELYEKIKDDVQNFPYAQLHRVKCLYELGKQADAKKSLRALLASKQQPKEVMQDALALQKELKLA